MSGPGEPAGQPIVQIRTPEKWTAGVYANGLAVWNTHTEFTLDFLVSLPHEQGTTPGGEQVVVAPQQVVARVKIPPVMVFQVMRNLAAAQDRYEAQFGPIPDWGAQTNESGA